MPRVLAYVTNFQSNNVAVVDTECGGIIATIPLPAGLAPLAVALAPDAQSAYVSVLTPGAPPLIVVIDTSRNRAVATIDLGPESDPSMRVAHDLAVSPDSGTLYVTGIDWNHLAIVDVIRRRTVGRVELTSALNRAAYRIAISPDGLTAYVTHGAGECGARTCRGGVDVVDIDRASPTFRTVVGALETPDADPIGIAVSPDGTLLYTTNTNYPASTVTVTNTVTGAVEAAFLSASHPEAIVVSADGRVAYVANLGSATVAVLDLDLVASTGLFHARARVGVDSPGDLALTPDQGGLYVTNQLGGAISRIDTASHEVVDVIEVGRGPNGIAIGTVQLREPATPVSGEQANRGSTGGAGNGCAVRPGNLRTTTAWWFLGMGLAAIRLARRRRHRRTVIVNGDR
jgi:YVTN family beta-propeller protein